MKEAKFFTDSEVEYSIPTFIICLVFSIPLFIYNIYHLFAGDSSLATGFFEKGSDMLYWIVYFLGGGFTFVTGIILYFRTLYIWKSHSRYFKVASILLIVNIVVFVTQILIIPAVLK